MSAFVASCNTQKVEKKDAQPKSPKNRQNSTTCREPEGRVFVPAVCNLFDLVDSVALLPSYQMEATICLTV